MKKFLLFLTILMLGVLTVNSQGPQNPCPTVSGVRKTNVVDNLDGTCSATITFHLANDVSDPNPKPTQVEVLCGSSTTPVLTQCFLAPAAPGADITTNQFTCSCSATITVRITRFTAGNGECQGGSCGEVIIIQESPLPVTLTAFNARRSQSRVILEWQTATELNNTGFHVERRVGDGDWADAGFVPTIAINGNSDSKLDYRFHDNNTIKGVTQYRLRQVDFDGKMSYSEVRSVRGEGQIGKVIIFPNPSSDGKVKLIFEDGNTVRDVTVLDMSGRTVKQVAKVTSNFLEFDNFAPGMYSARVIDRETNEQVMVKFLVNRK